MKPLIKAAFWIALGMVFMLAVLPADFDPVHFWDKFQHFAAFAILTLLGMMAYGRSRLTAVIVGLLFYGGLIEAVQGIPFVHRDADLHDWLADSLAIAGVAGSIWSLRLALARRNQTKLRC